MSSKYKSAFLKVNTEYNNRAGSFVAIIYILFSGASVTVAYIAFKSGVENVREAEIILPVYVAGLIFSVFSIVLLTLLRKKNLSHHRASEFVSILQACMLIVLFEISAHIEIPAIGIKNINAIILLMFCIVFLFRFRLSITFALEFSAVLATIIMLVIEKDNITNFYPSTINIIVAGFLACFSAYLYWRSRYKSFITQNVLNILATSDSLTNVLNRRGFDTYFSLAWEKAVAENTQLTLFILDIDEFKKYNDFYGHISGDECLAAVAGILYKSIRANDFVARYGGEEFAIALSCTDTDAAKIIADRIFANMRESGIPHAKSTVEPYVTISIGCMTCRPASTGLEQKQFLKMADDALYMAKEQGRNRLIIHPDAEEQ